MTPQCERAIKLVMQWECGPGGWPGDVTIPGDPGGATRAGISQRFYDPTGQKSVSDLSQDEVIAIYKTAFWDKIHGDDIVSSQLAYIVLDTAVNQGVVYAIKALQYLVQVPQDGVFGPQTLAAVNSKASDKFNSSLLWARMHRYVATCRSWQMQGKPDSWKFLSGWLDRLDFVRSNL